MAKWRSFGDRLLYCHRSTLKTQCKNYSNLASIQNSSTRRGGASGGGIKKAATFPRIPGCPSCYPPVASPRSLSSSPLLMLPPGAVVNGENNDDYFHFFSLSEQNQIRVGKNISMPWHRELLTPDDARCVGSSHGWLVFNHPRNCQNYLYNPLMDSPNLPYIPLPSIETLPSFRGINFLKSDHRSPSPSLITRFLISGNNSVRENLSMEVEHNYSSEQASGHLNLQKLAMSSAPLLPCYSSLSSSSKPKLDDDCTIMIIFSRFADIAFCKPGDDRWTVLDSNLRPDDIIYFSKDQRFYAIQSEWFYSTRSMEAWDISNSSCPKKQKFDGPDCCPGKLEDKFVGYYNFLKTNYLVESSGDLLMLTRFIAIVVAEDEPVYFYTSIEDLKVMVFEKKVQKNHNNYGRGSDEAYWTVGFDVRKFDFDHNKWEPVECLGDRALFVGSNHSFSLSTRDYPELVENSIYFTDDHFMKINNKFYGNYKKYDGHDNGIFCLGDNSIRPYYPGKLKINDPPPVWVVPNTIK